MPIVWELFAKQWLKRAERQNVIVDDVDRFICLWIAFNGWMKSQYLESMDDSHLIACAKKDTGLFGQFKELQESDVQFKDNLDHLERFSLTDMSVPVDLEQSEIGEIRYDGSFDSLMDVLYLVRCNLIYGRKTPADDDKDKELVSLAYGILYPLFQGYFKGISYSF